MAPHGVVPAPGELDRRRLIFGHAVASFDPTATSILLWTRLGDGAVEADWSLAADPELRDVVATGRRIDRARRATTPSSSTSTTSSRPRPTGTASRPAVERSPVGRTRTLPDGPRRRLPHRHRVLRPLLDRAARRLPGRSPSGRSTSSCTSATTSTRTPATTGPRPHDPPHTAITLDDYRRRLAQVRADPDAQALHLRHPMVAIWDDHDLATTPGGTGAKHHDPAEHGPWPVRVAAAAARPPGVAAGPAARPGATRWSRGGRWPIGDLAELVLLDTRLVGRDRQAGDDEGPPLDDPARSLLGDEQRAWLRERLRRRDPAVGDRGQRRGRQRDRAAVAAPAALDERGCCRTATPCSTAGSCTTTSGTATPPSAHRLVGWMRGAGRGRRAHGAAVGRRPLVVGVRRARCDPATGEPVAVEFTTPAVSSAAMGRAHYPGLWRVLDRAANRLDHVVWCRRHAPRLPILELTPPTRSAASGGSSTPTTRTRPPRPSWRRRS